MQRDLQETIRRQRRYFQSGITLDLAHRMKYLKDFYRAVKTHLPQIHNGLKADLGKSEEESYMCETGLVLNELSYMMRHLRRFAKTERVKTPLSQFKGKSYRIPSPYGTVLIMSPWNYPFLLAADPLIEAIAAGNTAVLKLSEYAPHTNETIQKLIGSVFPEEYVAAFDGDSQIGAQMLRSDFDYIFFTGSKAVGKIVCESAAKRMIPVTLELGGKSPCIVDETADIPLAARRIVWGKFLNLGQTCVAPDYIFCSRRIHDELILEIKKQIVRQFGDDPLLRPTYGNIISEKQFHRLCSLIDEAKVVHGGKTDPQHLKIEPTVMDRVCVSDAVMEEEIFGPILPIISYTDEREIVTYLASSDAPLAFYIFSSDKKKIRKFLYETGFGGGCVNDVVIHLATPYLPFGGFHQSGIGAYHGKAGFDTFTHYKSIVEKSVAVDPPMRYQPYKKLSKALIKFFLH